jgi:predicted phage gp36 major capsid-like protein
MSSSPLVFIEEQLARREEIVQRIEMMKNHLAGASENAIGSGEDYVDVTQREIEKLEAEVADIDTRIARLRDGKASESDEPPAEPQNL